MDFQVMPGVLVVVQEAPASAETQTVPLVATATSLVPSAEEATEDQLLVGALVCVQVWADVELTAVNQPQKAAAISIAILVFMRVWRFQANTGITHAIPISLENTAYPLADDH